MAPQRGLARLVSTNGHSHWAEPELRMQITNTIDGSPGGSVQFGFVVPCNFGGIPMEHWIGRDVTTGKACWLNAPWWFPSCEDAEAARDELAAQSPQEGE